MKTAPRAPFMPLSSDIDDTKLERLAAEKGVGALVKPVADRAGQGNDAPKPTMSMPTNAGEATATPRSDMKTVSLELPGYVWTAMKIRAVERQSSLKHVIMIALRKDGIAIEDVDMIEDGRRIRGQRSDVLLIDQY